MRPLSRFRALCPRPFSYSLALSPLLFPPPALPSIPSRPLRLRVLVIYMLERLVKTRITNERTDASRPPCDAPRAGARVLLGRCMHLCARVHVHRYDTTLSVC